MFMWVILGTLALFCIFLLWWEFRRDYREFQRMYRVRLPHLVHVGLTGEPDQIRWGRRRYRFIRQDGGKDRRRALNIKITYPTVLIVNHFKVYVLDLKYSRRLFFRMQDYMELPLADCTFSGDVRKDLWRYFRGRRIRFVRHIAKLFFRYGWYAELVYDQDYDIYIEREGRYYVVFCVFQPEKVCINDLCRVPRVVDVVHSIVATNTVFTSGAIEYAKSHNILLMDKPHINMSFDVDCIVFIGRQG